MIPIQTSPLSNPTKPLITVELEQGNESGPGLPLSGLKIGFVSDSLGQGGAERQLFYMLQALARANAYPHLITFSKDDYWEAPIKALGVPVHWLGPTGSKLNRLYRIFRYFQQTKVHLIQSVQFHHNLYVSLAARVLGLRDIGAIRSSGRREVQVAGRLSWFGLWTPSVLAGNSRNGLRYAAEQRVPKNRLFFLPNVVDSDRLYPASPGPKPVLRLLTVGRLLRVKRIDRFITALARVRAGSSLDIRGMVVGGGRPREDVGPELKRQAIEHGLTPAILDFQGAVENVLSIYHQADICVLTSDQEGTPNVLLEAMACGIPVVATRVGGVPEIIQHGETGFLVEPHDLDGLVHWLRYLCENPEVRRCMGQKGRDYILAHHAIHRLPSLLASLYGLAMQPYRKASINTASPIFHSPRPDSL